MRTCVDAVDPTNVPTSLGVQLVAGYDDGIWPDAPAMHARFPKAVLVDITVTGRDVAHVCDCENGDLTPAHAAAWAERKLAAHPSSRPTIYANLSTAPLVAAALDSLGIRGQCLLWLAHPDNDPTLPLTVAGLAVIAKQYRWTHGYDLSSVRDYWPGVDPAPPIQESDMTPEQEQRLIECQQDVDAIKATTSQILTHLEALASDEDSDDTWLRNNLAQLSTQTAANGNGISALASQLSSLTSSVGSLVTAVGDIARGIALLSAPPPASPSAPAVAQPPGETAAAPASDPGAAATPTDPALAGSASVDAPAATATAAAPADPAQSAPAPSDQPPQAADPSATAQSPAGLTQ